MSIKKESSLVDGARHLLNEVKLIKQSCDKKTQTILLDVVDRNNYFAHPEAVLTTMLLLGNSCLVVL